ncbi:MAG: hypothetical protein WDN45_05805 [Caulobacteraceae bacterium]
MSLFSDRRVILGGGGVIALLLGLGVAAVFASKAPKSSGPPPASQGGLVVEQGKDDSAPRSRPSAALLRRRQDGRRDDPGRLRQAQRRGHPGAGPRGRRHRGPGRRQRRRSGAADPDPRRGPAGPRRRSAPGPAGVAPVASGPGAPTAPCWKREADWRRLPTDLTLNACVQALYAGRCVKTGEALYGRWGEETLRLVPRRVEASSDNRTFRPLADQGRQLLDPRHRGLTGQGGGG